MHAGRNSTEPQVGRCAQPQMCSPDVPSARAMAPGYPSPGHCLTRIFPTQKELGLSQITHLPRQGGEILPFPQRLSAEFFQLHQPVVIAANTASHFGSLASLKCKTSPTQTFFLSKANTLSVTRTISLKHEQRARFPQTKELKVSF